MADKRKPKLRPKPKTFWFTHHHDDCCCCCWNKIRDCLFLCQFFTTPPFLLAFCSPSFSPILYLVLIPAIDLHVIFTCETVTHQTSAHFLYIYIYCCWTLVNCLSENNNKQRVARCEWKAEEVKWADNESNEIKTVLTIRRNIQHLYTIYASVHKCSARTHTRSSHIICIRTLCIHFIWWTYTIQSRVFLTNFFVKHFLSEWLTIKTTNSCAAAVAVTATAAKWDGNRQKINLVIKWLYIRMHTRSELFFNCHATNELGKSLWFAGWMSAMDALLTLSALSFSLVCLFFFGHRLWYSIACVCMCVCAR